jgi:hypothetical protein
MSACGGGGRTRGASAPSARFKQHRHADAGTRPAEQAPVVDRAAASATLIVGYLEGLQRLVQSAPAEQAEIVAGAQREYELAPTPSHQLRYALILATPGHAATDQPRAQRRCAS